MKETILNYVRGGLSVVPIVEGQKRCALPAHYDDKPCIQCPHFFQYERLATEEEVEAWVNRGDRSWGIYNGAISGNTIGFDFECHTDPTIYDRWYARLSDEQKKLVDTLVIDKSRRGGRHVFCRTETTKFSTQLAARPSTDPEKPEEKELLIETRGNGSLLLIPPSAGYETIQGNLASIPLISDEMFEELADVARSLNEWVEEEDTSEPYVPADTSSTLPGDIFNREGNWEFLKEFGWKETYKDHWTRPGKDEADGISATTNWKGFPIFYCFSSSAAPFKAKKCYSRFSCLTTLKFNNNPSACASYLSTEQLTHPAPFTSAETKPIVEIKREQSMSFRSLMTTKFPDAKWIIEPLFESFAINMVSAPPNNWKSWLLLLFSEKISKGESILNKFNTEKTNVMIVNEEDTYKSLQERFNLLKITDLSIPIFFRVATGIKLEKAVVDDIIAEAKERNIKLVIFDSLRSVHEADENSSTEMQKIMDQLKRFTKENITVIFTHHHRKSNFTNKEDAESSRGSSAINAAISGHISLKEEERSDGTFIIVKHLKSKAGEKLKPFEIKIEKERTGDEVTSISFSYGGEEKGLDKKLQETKSKIMYIISAEPEKWKTAKDFSSIAGICTVRGALKMLTTEGKLKSLLRKEIVEMKIPVNSEGPKNEILYSIVEQQVEDEDDEEIKF